MAVNRRLLPVKAIYFFTFAGIGSLLPFFIVYMRQLGLSPSECAIIYGISPFLAALVRPVYGLIADKLHRHRLILIVCFISCSIFTGCLLLVPSVAMETRLNQPENITMFCTQNGSHLEICSRDNNPDCMLNFERTFHALADNETVTEEWDSGRCSVVCEAVPESMCIHSLDRHTCMTSSGMLSFNATLAASSYDITIGTQRSACMDLTMHTIEYNDVTVTDFFCYNDSMAQCFILCGKEDIYQCDTFNNEAFQKTFWIFAALFFITKILSAPVVSLIDALTYSHLGEERSKWGSQRVWGTIGFAAFGVTSGFVMDAVSEESTDIDYSWCFALFIVHSLLASAAVYFYVTTSDVRCSKAMKKLRLILTMPEVLALLMLLFVFGMFTGVIETLLFWHLLNLGAPQLLLGLCMVMSCLPEIFILLVLGRILDTFGEIICLYSVCFAYVARFLGYSFLEEPWFVLLIEPLHGFTYGVMYGAATSLGSRITPSGMHGTVQAMISAVHFGIGKGFGSLVGGPVFEHYGAAATFQACAVLSAIVFVLYAMAQLALKLRRSKHRPDQDDDAKPTAETEMIGSLDSDDQVQYKRSAGSPCDDADESEVMRDAPLECT